MYICIYLDGGASCVGYCTYQLIVGLLLFFLVWRWPTGMEVTGNAKCGRGWVLASISTWRDEYRQTKTHRMIPLDVYISGMNQESAYVPGQPIYILQLTTTAMSVLL